LFPALFLSLSNEDSFLVSIFQYFFRGFDLSGEFLMLFKLPAQEPIFKNLNLNFTV
jgi:hypothetical protein